MLKDIYLSKALLTLFFFFFNFGFCPLDFVRWMGNFAIFFCSRLFCLWRHPCVDTMNMMQGLPGMGEGGKLMAKLDEILDKQSKLEDDVAELKGTGGGGATASRKKSMWKGKKSV